MKEGYLLCLPRRTVPQWGPSLHVWHLPGQAIDQHQIQKGPGLGGRLSVQGERKKEHECTSSEISDDDGALRRSDVK